MDFHEPTPVTPEGLAAEILRELELRANPDSVAGMARYGISSIGMLGVPVPWQRQLAADAKRRLKAVPDGASIRHATAQLLWDSGIHEARTDRRLPRPDPAPATREQTEAWASDFDSWDIGDQVTTSLFDRTPYAWRSPRSLGP